MDSQNLVIRLDNDSKYSDLEFVIEQANDLTFEMDNLAVIDITEDLKKELVVKPAMQQQVIVPEGRDVFSKVIVEPVELPFVDVSDTTATADTVTEGKTFYDASGQKVVGTRGADMLQAKVDSMGGKYLFYYYTGNDLDFAKDLDISNVTDMSSAFSNCKNVKDFSVIENWDWSNVKTAQTMFANCTFTEAPNIDMSNVENANNAFQYCYSLKSMPQYNLSKATSLNGFALNCTQLENMPQLNLASAKSLVQFMSYCTKIKTLPEMNTSNVENFSSFASGAGVLEAFTQDTRNATNTSSMFYYCSKLETVNMDMRKVTNANYMFGYCLKLTNLALKNINVALQIGSGTTWGHLLTLDSLINTVQELWTGTASRTLTMATASKTKLASVYVKLVDITDEMRGQDEFIDKKLPFAVCESTDEGAMLITDYAKLKNWTIA